MSAAQGTRPGQSPADEGRLTPEEAASHPQRSLLLSAAVTAQAVHDVLATAADPDEAVRRLVDLANDAGGPDNVTCVVADVADVAGIDGEAPDGQVVSRGGHVVSDG